MDQQNLDKKDMFLESSTGYFMPFPGNEEHDVEISLGYGEQVHPATGQKFNHTGVDLLANHLPLFACATGAVVGVGSDAIHDNYIITRYGSYEVKYGHVSEAYCGYASRVKAGQQIAKSGDFLHLEVKFNGQLINPVDFLQMLYSNIVQLSTFGIKSEAQFVDLGAPVKTDYDADQDEILQLMLRWLPEYMNDIRLGNYQTSERIEGQLRNIFSQSADKHYFYENMPTVANPLGLSSRSSLLAGKIQSLLIGDFLNYLGSRHNIFVSSWDDAKKKLLSNRFQAV